MSVDDGSQRTNDPEGPIRLAQIGWVLPLDRTPIRDGIIAFDDQRILFVGNEAEFARAPLATRSVTRSEHPTSIAIPGLVNAHTHLEFSLLSPLGQPGIQFTDWIRMIVQARAELLNAGMKELAISEGLRASFSAGVWAIGEIAAEPFTRMLYKTDGHSAQSQVIFHEQLGRNLNDFASKREQLDLFLTGGAKSSELDNGDAVACDFGSRRATQRLGASPHAPYSTHPILVKQMIEQANAGGHAVAMHLAETRAELDLLATQTGDFVQLLSDFGVWSRESFLPPISMEQILDSLAAAPRSLLIHGNYLTTAQLDSLARSRESMSIVFCPRTHAYFQHDNYPLPAMRERGINVALGTDSCASSPNLDLWQDVKLVAESFPELSLPELVQMATANGAAALGLTDRHGVLTAGRPAAISLIEGLLPTGSDNLNLSASDTRLAWGDSRCRPLV